MAGTVPEPLRPRRVGGHTSVPLWAAKENASIAVTVLRGSVLLFSGGYLDTAAASAVAGIVGISTTTAHNDSVAGTHLMEYVPALPGLRFEGTLENDSSNAHTLVQTNLGIAYGLAIDATNHRWFLDVNDTSTVSCNVTKLISAIGATKPRVEFVFMASTTVYSVAAG